MATPSSSATSPSPPMTFLPRSPVPPQSSSTASIDPLEREQRKKAVQKFLARAEISMVTRALRARLSYASYKATHNIHHVPLRDLEAQTQTQSQTASFSRTIAAKRKAAGNNYYNNPATQGLNGSGSAANTRRGGSGAMPPPTTTSSPRTYYPAINNAYATTSNNDPGSSSRTVNPGQSLYSSILAPPPTKQARTIHNASDPPVPAPSRPTASPRTRAPKAAGRSIAENTRAHTKARPHDKASGNPVSPDRRRAARGSIDKGKQKRKSTDMDMDADGDVDMKAAATLTSLLLHHRPSITGSASSPRSSIDGSEAGSAYSHSHFAQSSARTVSAASPPTATLTGPFTSTATEPSLRSQTPPPNPGSASSTPRPAPTDNEAADLMLFLATSPSPARPSSKDSRDLAAYRALGGGAGALRDKGRVLFPSMIGGEPPGPDEPPRQVLPLTRGGDSSFTSSISSIGTEMGMRSVTDSSVAKTVNASSQLLPPASLPEQTQTTDTQPHKSTFSVQGPVDFNFNDFIHASPSPSRSTVSQTAKGNLGLRADVGRKLFEEEQMRHAMSGAQSPSKRQEERSLGAGIDLLHS